MIELKPTSAPFDKGSPQGEPLRWAVEVDARGLTCPLPLLKAKQGLQHLAVGESLRLLATDKGSVRDIQAFVKLTEHHLRYFDDSQDYFEYIVEKGGKS